MAWGGVDQAPAQPWGRAGGERGPPFSEVARVHPEAAGRKARGSAMTAPWGQHPCTRLAPRRRGRLGFRAQLPPAFRATLAEACTRSTSAPAAPAPRARARTAPSSPLSPRLPALEFGAPQDPLLSPVFSPTAVHISVPREAVLLGPGLGLPPGRLAEPGGSWRKAPPPLWFPAHPPASALAQAPGRWMQV